MAKFIMERLVGNLEEKRAYRRFMKRVSALPKDYRFAFYKMRSYLYNTDLSGCGMLFSDLVELLESSAAENRPVLDVFGGDVASFCDELVRASAPDRLTAGEKLNREILEHFHGEGKKF